MTRKRASSSPNKAPEKPRQHGRSRKAKSPQVPQQRGEPRQRFATGFACPVCGLLVPISLRSLVASANVQCANPRCRTLFSASGAESLKVIDALKTYVHKLE